VNARFTGPHNETPLHWAASSDDVGVLDALIDAGADIEVRGAVIAGGTPDADATAFG
jgi:ankyrin repeat protein